jgi:hypothetical protein
MSCWTEGAAVDAVVEAEEVEAGMQALWKSENMHHRCCQSSRTDEARLVNVVGLVLG